MTANQVARLLAVCVGSVLVLNAIADTSGLLVSASVSSAFADMKPWLYLYSVAPLLGAVVFAILIYSYAVKLSLEDIAPTNIELLAVGIKLLGLSTLIRSVPRIIAFVFGLSVDSAELNSVWIGLVGLAHFCVGYLMVFRTTWLIVRITAND